MRNDFFWAEWEMDYRVTNARKARQQDRLARLCSEAEETEPPFRCKGGKIQETKLASLVNRLRSTASHLLGPL
jgi:hypothetical protein